VIRSTHEFRTSVYFCCCVLALKEWNSNLRHISKQNIRLLAVKATSRNILLPELQKIRNHSYHIRCHKGMPTPDYSKLKHFQQVTRHGCTSVPLNLSRITTYNQSPFSESVKWSTPLLTNCSPGYKTVIYRRN